MIISQVDVISMCKPLSSCLVMKIQFSTGKKCQNCILTSQTQKLRAHTTQLYAIVFRHRTIKESFEDFLLLITFSFFLKLLVGKIKPSPTLHLFIYLFRVIFTASQENQCNNFSKCFYKSSIVFFNTYKGKAIVKQKNVKTMLKHVKTKQFSTLREHIL